MVRTVVQNVKLFDGVHVKDNATVSFDSETGKIRSVSFQSTQDLNRGDVVVVDGTGHTLIPGLIDAHIHTHFLHHGAPTLSVLSDILKPAFKCGITTVCDMHSDPPTVLQQRREIRDEVETAKVDDASGRVTLPDLKTAFYAATMADGWPKPIVMHGNPSESTTEEVARWPSVTVDTAKSYIQGNKKLGADYIKLMQENCRSLAFPTDSVPAATKELQTAIVDAAHEEGFLTVGHALDINNTELLLQSGIDGLTHTFIDQEPTDRVVNLYKEKGAFLIPTLTVLTSLAGEAQELRDKFAQIAFDKGFIDERARDDMVSMMNMKDPDARIEYAYESVRRLHSEGIDIVAGTDSVTALKGTAIGPSLWMEMQLYVSKCGFSPIEALQAATSVAARRFNFSDRGVIQEGKRADLVLVEGDLTRHIDALWSGTGVLKMWKEGLAG